MVHIGKLRVDIDESVYRKTYYNSIILICLIILTLIGFFTGFSQFNSITEPHFIGLGGAIILFVLAYIVTKSKRPNIGSYITVLTLLALPFAVIQMRNDFSQLSIISSANWLLLGILIGCVLLTPIEIIIVSVITILALITWPFLNKDFDFQNVLRLLGFVSSMSVLIIAITFTRASFMNKIYEKSVLLKKMELQYETLIQNMNEGVLHVNNSQIIQFANRRFCEISGYSIHELIGRNVMEVLLNVNQQEDFINKTNCGKPDQSDSYEFQITTKSGKKTWLRASCAPYADIDGKIVGSIGVHTDITAQKNAENELMKQQKKRMTDIIITQEKEKKRISRDLHDGTGQLLFGLRMKLSNKLNRYMTDQKGVDGIAELQNDINYIIRDLKRVSFQLSPRNLEDFGLISATKKLCQEIQDYTGSRLEFHYDEFERLSAETESNVYRIIQEAVGNSLRHARPEFVVIDLKKDKDQIKLRISDNGVGFNMEKSQNDGKGISYIKERVELLEGSFKLNSVIDKGTELEIQFPSQNKL